MKPLPELHSNFSYRIDYVGQEMEPVLVINNFLADAESLIDIAAQSTAFNAADAYYPGLRAPAPNLYIQAMHYYLHDLVADVFGLKDENISGVEADFSMVITPPDQLKPMQSIPHFDSAKHSELAAVHYLCSADKGGTSLYRHKATGFESVDSDRLQIYKEKVNNELNQQSSVKQYMNGSNNYFEQIASYEAEFNRLIMYRCTSLHSGNISPDFTFDTNPRSGRLTLNTFIYCRE